MSISNPLGIIEEYISQSAHVEDADALAALEQVRAYFNTANKMLSEISERIHADPSSPLLTQFNVFAGNAEIVAERIAELQKECAAEKQAHEKTSDRFKKTIDALATVTLALQIDTGITIEQIVAELPQFCKNLIAQRNGLEKQMQWLENRLGELPSSVSKQIFGSSDWTRIEDAFKNATED